MNSQPLVDSSSGNELPHKNILVLLRLLRWLAAVDFFALMLTGGYQIPFTHLFSLYPCTSLFLILLTTLLIHWARGETSGGKKDWLGTDGRILIAVWMVFLGNFRWRGSGDVVAASLQPFALLEHGHLYLDEYFPGSVEGDVSGVYRRGGHVLSKYPSAPGLCLVPFDLIPGLAGVKPTDLFLHQTQKIGASFIVVLSVLLVLKSLLLFLPRREAWFLALAYAFGTSAFSVSSQAIWQHGPGQLFLSLGMWLLLKGISEDEGNNSQIRFFAFVGFSFAMAAWCRYTNILFYPAILGYFILKQRRGLIPFILGSVLPFAAIGLDNIAHSGLPWLTGYPGGENGFHTPLAEGIPGVLFSPARGLFLFSPFLLFGFYGFYGEWKNHFEALFKLLSVSALALVLLISKYDFWTGGFCFGPRYFADMDPILVLACVPAIPLLKKPVWGGFWCLAVVYSFLIHFLGAYVSWKWEGKPIWAPAHHPVLFCLLGGEGASVETRIMMSIISALVLGLATWFALKWARSFRANPI